MPDINAVTKIDPPLAGVRIVDATNGWAEAIGQQLAELGADVSVTGQRPDAHGPFVGSISLERVLRNRRKRHAEGDFEVLLADADILIASPGACDVRALRDRYPRLVILHASDFGLEGRHAGWQATGPVLHALSGELSRSGQPGRTPLLPPGDLAYACAVSQAVFATAVAYCERLRTDDGDLLDFAALDGAVQALDPGYGIGGSATLGVHASKLPRGRPAVGHQYPILPCADGKVRIAVLAPRQWQGLFGWMGHPKEFADPSFNKTGVRFASTTLMPAVAAFFADKSRKSLEEEGARRGVPIAGLRTLAEALESDQLKARGAFADIEIAPGVRAPAPLGVVEIDGQRLSSAPKSAPPPASPISGAGGTRPFEGLRVLDLGVIVVGAESGRLLADQGADVIKVEASAFLDGSRNVRNADGMSVTVAAGHRNKRSLGINLRHEDGKALFRQLAAKSDIIFSNFKAGTMESLGLGYDTISRLNPGIVMIDSSAYGPTGPWSQRLGYGPLVRASAGLTALWRYDDDPESYSDAITVYPDHVAGRIGAIAALALLVRRGRSSHGGTVSISQAEVMLSHLATDIAAAALREKGIAVENAPRLAPWGVYPCAGDDEWCVVTVRDQADRVALCRIVEVNQAARDDAVEAALVAWLAVRSPSDAMEALQAAGVPAAAMLRVSELPAFEYFKARRLFRTEHHPRLPEPLIVENAPVVATRLPDPPVRPAPIMGEHTVEIARDILGLGQAEIDDLVARGVLETPEAFERG